MAIKYDYELWQNYERAFDVQMRFARGPFDVRATHDVAVLGVPVEYLFDGVDPFSPENVGLIGVGKSVSTELPTDMLVKVVPAVPLPADAYAGYWVKQQPRTTSTTDPEVFTNIDRMPDESGPLAEVTRAMRLFELEKQAFLADLRRERDALAGVPHEPPPSEGITTDPPAEGAQ